MSGDGQTKPTGKFVTWAYEIKETKSIHTEAPIFTAIYYKRGQDYICLGNFENYDTAFEAIKVFDE